MVTKSEIQQANQAAKQDIDESPEWVRKEARAWSRSLRERRAFWRSARPQSVINAFVHIQGTETTPKA